MLFFLLLLYILKVSLNIFTTDDDVSHIAVISQNCGRYVVEKFTKKNTCLQFAKILAENHRDKLLRQFLHLIFMSIMQLFRPPYKLDTSGCVA